MTIRRDEILPGVFLTCVEADCFKTGIMSAFLLAPLSRETASMNALIPYVLRRGTDRSPDMDALAKRLDLLYGARVDPCVLKLGEIQCLGFLAEFCDERFLPEKPDLAGECAALLAELFLNPNTRGGLLRSEYVESESKLLASRIDALKNDKRNYAKLRLIEHMCAYEDYGVSTLGTREDAEDIYYVALSKHYRELLASSPVELFYCGSCKAERMREAMSDAFLALPRGELNEELGTDIRMNAVEARVRSLTEHMDVEQTQLVLGFRLGECMDDPDLPTLLTLSTLYGGGSSSLLFQNVREKRSLCYYCYATAELFKGILIAQAGVERDGVDAAREEMLAQLEALREGKFSDEELLASKKLRAEHLRSVPEDPELLFDHWFTQALYGLMATPEELAEAVEAVTREDILAAAAGICLDAEYILTGEEHD